MKIQCLHFNNKKIYKYITHFESEYYLSCYDSKLKVYSLVKYDKEKGKARDILYFEKYFDFKKDIYDSCVYIMGVNAQKLMCYKIRKNVIIQIFEFNMGYMFNVVDFFVLKGYLFFYLRSKFLDDKVLYMLDEDKNFIIIEDEVLKNLINPPLYFSFFDKEVLVIEEFYIKSFFASFDIKNKDNFSNNIFIVDFESFIKSIKSKKEILYNILRSNKGLNYITILNQFHNQVVLFLSRPFLKNNVIFYDLENNEKVKEVKTEDVLLSYIKAGNKYFYKAIDNNDNEIIYDDKINKIFSWHKEFILKGFMFMGVFFDRYMIFKKENTDKKDNIYNVYDMKLKLSRTFLSKLIILDEEILL